MLNENETPRLMVSANEAARILSVSIQKVYELASAGVLEKRYIGARNFRIPYASLELYVDTLPKEPTDWDGVTPPVQPAPRRRRRRRRYYT